MNTRTRRIGMGATTALALVAAGCETSTVPDLTPEFDTEAAVQDYDAMDQALGSDDWAGFQALGDRTPFGSSPAAIDAMASLGRDGAPGVGASGRAFAVDFARGLASAWRSNASGGPALGPIISGWNRGTTFVYDPQTDDYQPDLTREGAPATGVRFIIYEVDAAGVPIVSEPSGYADLIDEGDGSVEDIALRLNVVHHDTVVLEYVATLDHDATTGRLTLDGFLYGDGVRLDFGIAVDARPEGETTLLDISFDFGVEARDFTISGVVSGVEESDDGLGEVDIEVQHREASIRVDMTGTAVGLDGTFYVNGDVFATVTGPEEALVFVNADGEPLSIGEWLVVRRIVDVVEDVFDFMEDLVDPLDEILLLAIIL